jgi:dTDP-4-dehydrorhamnose reductase
MARNVAIAARAEASRLIHISTDYVFDGNGPRPYAIDRPQRPASAYGRTKVAGEWAVRAACPDALVVRTAWLYGDHGPNFVKAILSLASEQETLRVVDDQVGQPTWTCDLAGYLASLGEGGSPGGYYHGTNGGEVSRYDFARTIFSVVGLTRRALFGPSRLTSPTVRRARHTVSWSTAAQGGTCLPLPRPRRSIEHAKGHTASANQPAQGTAGRDAHGDLPDRFSQAT